MSGPHCANCGELIVRSGTDFRGEPRYVHRSSNEIRCSMFARLASTPVGGGERVPETERTGDGGAVVDPVVPATTEGHKVFVVAEGEWVRLDDVTDTPEPVRLRFMLSGDEARWIAQSLLDAVAPVDDNHPAV